MKIWVDDIRPIPDGYIGFKSTNSALRYIIKNVKDIELIDLDHDSGDFQSDGGDYINIVRELERLTIVRNIDFSHIKFKFHSANPVGVQNMRNIIQKNNWIEVK